MGVVGVRGMRILGRVGPRLAYVTAEKKIRWRKTSRTEVVIAEVPTGASVDGLVQDHWFGNHVRCK